MNSPGLRALLHPAVLAARAPRPRLLRQSLAKPSCRLLFARLSSSATPNDGSKPAGSDSPVDIQDEDDVHPHSASDSSAARSRVRASSSLKSRYARRAAASPLPPVQLPQHFLDDNVLLHDRARRPRLPPALAFDTMFAKVSSISIDHQPGDNPVTNLKYAQAIESYFDAAFEVFTKKAGPRIDSLVEHQPEKASEWAVHSENVAYTARFYDMLIDSAWHLADCLYPARQAQYLYKSNPFWWWHYYKDFDQISQRFRDQFLPLEASISSVLDYDWRLDHSLSQAIADFPFRTFASIQHSLRRELNTPAPVTLDVKTLKRQVTVLSMSGYSGQGISEALAEHVAFFNEVNLIRLDAQDLSVLVSDYLGQDWAYSRGSLSVLGFRAAEMNGKLYREPDDGSRMEDDDNEPDTGIINIRAAGGQFEDEVQKIKQKGYDPFGKWDSLKIDKVLGQILLAADKKHGGARTDPLLIHIHDYVELSMTLEGSILLGRLRSLVDAAWQNGAKIAILGTSATETPSDEYQNTLRDLSIADHVITRHVDPNRPLVQPHPTEGGRKVSKTLFPLQDADLFVENIRNINRMIRILGGKEQINLFDEPVKNVILLPDSRAQWLKKSILPLPEVYNIAQAARELEEKAPGSSSLAVMERLLMGPPRQRLGQRFLDDDEPEIKDDSADSQKKAEDSQSGNRASLKLNEYEKRISSGHINRQNLRTTFEDVHVPPDTISALKLLTSLALVRPDAFSYGVLAQDRIPGCLLYGPPGTGKTLLAKAVAKESGANMLEISGATINDKWVGESEKLIHAVFTLAKKISPCVVFIDEADSLLANRSMLGARASHRSHINQFLKEWDGLEETEAFIMVATNRPFDLDDAVLRRLPRRLLVDLPLQADRAAILKILLKDEVLEDAISLEDLAKRTPFYSGSDLKNACVAAAMAAVEEENEAAAKHTGPEPYEYPKKRTLCTRHFDKALKQIPASISEDMQSLKQIRKFDEEYGAKKKGAKKSMGFGVGLDKKQADAEEVRIRPGSP